MITVKGLGKSFGEGEKPATWVFQNANLNVEREKSAVIVGPSGSGKSVFLKCLAGLIEPTAGEVQLGSKNIGMLFQKNALFDSLTLEENLIFPYREKTGTSLNAARDRAHRFLEAVGLKGSEKLLPDEISGGMQKRLGIARALVVEPEIIFYDEPTAGLDPITSKKIADLILTLKKENGSTVVAVTNDMQRAYQLGNQIYLLAEGRLGQGGTPEEVKRTKDPALRQFIFGLLEGPLTS